MKTSMLWLFKLGGEIISPNFGCLHIGNQNERFFVTIKLERYNLEKQKQLLLLNFARCLLKASDRDKLLTGNFTKLPFSQKIFPRMRINLTIFATLAFEYICFCFVVQ